MPFELPALPYDFAALEPHIDARTMEIHHGKHHQAYVDNANKALDGTEWADRSVEDVLTELEVMPEAIRTAVRNNAGGHANHSLFWQIMGPDGGGEPEGALAEAIADTFGGVDQLKEQVNDGGVKRFGSGWTWLVWDGTGLAVYSTPNQDSPIMTGDVAAARHRRLGARLLPQLPEPAPRLPRRLVERGQLGGGRQALRRSAVASVARSRLEGRRIPPTGGCRKTPLARTVW